MKNFRVWKLYTLNSFQQTLANKIGFLIFIPGKIIRMLMFLVFLSLVLSGTSGLGTYTGPQAIFFYLSYNLIDTASQLLFREVYRFRPLLVSGNFDLVLTKPVNPLIRVLLGGADIFDVVMLLIISILTFFFGLTLNAGFVSWLLYLGLLLNGLLISMSLHIFVLGLGVRVLTIDHIIWIYRDLSAMMRIPVDLYVSPLRQLLTFVIPVGIMFSFPPLALMNLLSLPEVFFALLIALCSMLFAYNYWKHSLRFYQSASS
jgi:ABC-type uncharacterized transport system permease subunit